MKAVRTASDEAITSVLARRAASAGHVSGWKRLTAWNAVALSAPIGTASWVVYFSNLCRFKSTMYVCALQKYPITCERMWTHGYLRYDIVVKRLQFGKVTEVMAWGSDTYQ